MDSFEINKILGAVLATCIVLLVTSFTASAMFAPKLPEKPGFAIAAKERRRRQGSGGTAAPSEPIEKLLQTASVEKGQAAAKSLPDLPHLRKERPEPRWSQSLRHRRRPQGRRPRRFNFSAAMKAKGGTWTYDDLNTFLTNPKGFVPGTAMGFAGIQKDSQRADVIAYLRTLSDSPEPLPTASK